MSSSPANAPLSRRVFFSLTILEWAVALAIVAGTTLKPKKAPSATPAQPSPAQKAFCFSLFMLFSFSLRGRLGFGGLALPHRELPVFLADGNLEGDLVSPVPFGGVLVGEVGLVGLGVAELRGDRPRHRLVGAIELDAPSGALDELPVLVLDDTA